MPKKGLECRPAVLRRIDSISRLASRLFLQWFASSFSLASVTSISVENLKQNWIELNDVASAMGFPIGSEWKQLAGLKGANAIEAPRFELLRC